MRSRELRLVITFVSTADAMAAEQAFRKHQVSGRTIPVPRTLSASCGIAWCTRTEERTAAEKALTAEGITAEGMFECMLYVSG